MWLVLGDRLWTPRNVSIFNFSFSSIFPEIQFHFRHRNERKHIQKVLVAPTPSTRPTTNHYCQCIPRNRTSRLHMHRTYDVASTLRQSNTKRFTVQLPAWNVKTKNVNYCHHQFRSRECCAVNSPIPNWREYNWISIKTNAQIVIAEKCSVHTSSPQSSSANVSVVTATVVRPCVVYFLANWKSVDRFAIASKSKWIWTLLCYCVCVCVCVRFNHNL